MKGMYRCFLRPLSDSQQLNQDDSWQIAVFVYFLLLLRHCRMHTGRVLGSSPVDVGDAAADVDVGRSIAAVVECRRRRQRGRIGVSCLQLRRLTCWAKCTNRLLDELQISDVGKESQGVLIGVRDACLEEVEESSSCFKVPGECNQVRTRSSRLDERLQGQLASPRM